ncbi:15109_t:CDS:2, partial [Funneliformis caledonium]
RSNSSWSSSLSLLDKSICIGSSIGSLNSTDSHTCSIRDNHTRSIRDNQSCSARDRSHSKIANSNPIIRKSRSQTPIIYNLREHLLKIQDEYAQDKHMQDERTQNEHSPTTY